MSAAAYDERCDQQYFYSIDNGNGNIFRFDRDGTQVGSTITTGFGSDREGLEFLGEDGFDPGNGTAYHWCVLEEGDLGGAPNDHPRLYFFDMDGTTTTVSSAGYTAELDDIETFSGLGGEGVCFDRENELFYIGVQSCQQNEGGLWEVDPSIHVDTDESWQQTRLFYWYDTLGPGGENIIETGTSCGDIYFGRSWLPDTGAGTIFVLFNSNQGGTTDLVAQIDTSGNLLSQYDSITAGQFEGICFDDSIDNDMYILGEPAGTDWYRHSIRGSGTTLIDWQESWRYEDRYSGSTYDYITATDESDLFWHDDFDVDNPPKGNAAFKTGNALLGDPTISGLTSPHSGIDTTWDQATDESDNRNHYVYKEFSVTQAQIDAHDVATLRWIVDDGAWIWINGTLVESDNVASGGPTSYEELASANRGGSEEGQKRSTTFSKSLLIDGTNTIKAIRCDSSTGGQDSGWDARIELSESEPDLGYYSGCLSTTSTSSTTTTAP